MNIIDSAPGGRLAVFKITAGVFLISAAAFHAAADEYDLSAYLLKVQRNNTDIALAYRELRFSRETVNQARAPLLPG
ncbi:MAG: hypothetical protein LBQ30_06665, partial [Treponema sp.]|nr:hypothetical protein [Treponema sp.]